MAVNFQVYDSYQWSIWRKMYQLELTLKPLLQIFELPKNLHGSSFSLHATRGTMKFFELQTVLQSMENLHLPSKRVAQVKNSSGPWCLSCLSCVDRAKSILKKKWAGKQWGEGVRSESRRNSYNQPRSQGFSHWIWKGREKTLALAGHVIPNTRKFWV